MQPNAVLHHSVSFISRKELDTRVSFNGPEFQDAVAKDVSRAERLHGQQIREFQEKMNVLSQQYTDLEDEFRAALIIESGRFKEVLLCDECADIL